MSHMPSVYIAGTARTPIGAFLGSLSALTAPELGTHAIRAALERSALGPDSVDAVLMGNVLPAGVGQAPARQAALGAKIPNRVPCTTVSKVCGSGLEALIMGYRSIMLNEHDVVVVGGMESMSNTPYYLKRARTGLRMGHAELTDGMIHDGLWDPYNNFHMGNAAELCVGRFELSRETQDAFAAESVKRARQAQAQGWFDAEITPLRLASAKGAEQVVQQDEQPGRANPERLPQLRPVFDPNGSVTAGNASSINDGAAALILASEAGVNRFGLRPRARIMGHAAFAQAPEWFTTAPADASQRVLQKLGLHREQIDLWEINEAFACVTLAVSRILELDPSRVNVHGGAVALGHPIGASGARIVVTLLSALERLEQKRGLASICIGGGEALALVIERL
jgi:acetyl-CoA C-acetyltransferase